MPDFGGFYLLECIAGETNTSCLGGGERKKLFKIFGRYGIMLIKDFLNSIMLKLHSDDEIKCLMQVTGENGSHCEAKLGVEGPKTIKELSTTAKERIRYWNERANDIPMTRYYEEAAQVLARSYSILNFHLESLLGE